MTPPRDIRNFFLGQSSPLLESAGESIRLEGIEDQARLTHSMREAFDQRQREASAELITLGSGSHGDTILQSLSETGDDLERLLNSTLDQAHAGERRSYYDGLRLFFVLVHRSLQAPDGETHALRLLHRFVSTVAEYSGYMREATDLNDADRFRYLFAASQVVRTMLGRVDSVDSDELNGIRQDLRESLLALYTQLQEHHQAMLVANPEAEPYTGVLREIQMRQALLEGHPEIAQARAEEITQYYTAHPPPEYNSQDPSTGAWDVRAGRALMRDPEFQTLVPQLDIPSTHEDTSALLNGVGYEMLQIVGSTLDRVNEEEESAVQARYQALSLGISALSLTRPGSTLRELIDLLADANRSPELAAELEQSSQGNETLHRLYQEALGEASPEHLLERIREAAVHIQSLHTVPGEGLLEAVFIDNERPNLLHQVASELETHPQLLQYLGFSTDHASREAAVALLRQGSVASSRVQQYAAAHPEEELTALTHYLASPADAAGALNQLSESLLDFFEADLDSQPDHTLACIHNVVSALAQTQEIGEGLNLSDEVRTRALELLDRMEGFSFRAGRILDHQRSWESILSLLGGVAVSRLLPAFFLSRVGEGGRYTLAGMELVQAGRLTAAGVTVSGLGTGLAISAISTGLQTHAHASQGLQTHLGRDFALSAGINMVTFGATMRFGRWYGQALMPAAEDAAAIGGLGGWRRMALHLGVPAFGATVALGLGWGSRYAMTGEFHSSWDEVAENYLSVLAWELGDAAVARTTRHFGLDFELAGRSRFQVEPLTPGSSLLRRAGHHVSRGFAEFGNLLLTHLGPYRSLRTLTVADRVVQEMLEASNGGAEVTPEQIRNHPFRSFIARQLAIQELSAPGSLDYYHEAFFRRMVPIIAGDEGAYRLIFIPRRNFETTHAPETGGSGRGRRPVQFHDTRSEEAPTVRDDASEDTALLDRTRISPQTSESPPVVRRPTPPTVATRAASTLKPSDVWGQPLIEWWRNQPDFQDFLRLAERTLLPRAERDPRLNRFSITFSREDGNFSFSVDLNPTQPISRPRLQIVGTYDLQTRSLIFPAFPGQRGEIVLDLATGRFSPRPPPPPGASEASAPRPRRDAAIMDMSQGIPRVVLQPRSELRGTTPNRPGSPREVSHAAVLESGDVSAFTTVGIDKHILNGGDPSRPVNEDAFGILRDGQGRSVLIVADGMGGHGKGDIASSMAVEHTLDYLRDGSRELGDAMIRAHSDIQQFNAAQQPRGRSGSVATAVRISPDGQVEVGTVGDTRLWVARRHPDGSYRITEPFRPDSMAGNLREMGRLGDTLTMNASDLSSTVLSGMGLGEPLRIVSSPPAGERMRLLQTRLPHPLGEGDVLIMMSDGVADLFNRAQMEDTLGDSSTDLQILRAIQGESTYRLNLYPSASRLLDGQRLRIAEGSFSGNFIDNRGDIYSANQGGTLVGHIGPDNLVCLVYRHRGSVAVEGSTAE